MIIKLLTLLSYAYQVGKIIINNIRANDPELEKLQRAKAKEGYELAITHKDPKLIARHINE